MRIVLCRHGETAWNREGRYQGQIDIPLSPDGEAQAAALGRRLADLPLMRAVASPLSRARRTAELALGPARLGLLQLDADLQEIAHGSWEGMLVEQIAASDGERLAAWRSAPETVVMPGGESLADVDRRAWRGFVRAADRLGETDTLLIAAHDAVNRVLLCRVLGLPLSRLWCFRQAPATLNLLEGPAVDRLELVRLNDAGHLSDLFGEARHRSV